jgi:hypothetical protein
MRACSGFCKACHLPENILRNAQALRELLGCCAGNHVPRLWLNRIPLETGAAAPRMCVEDDSFFKKASTRRG